MPSRQGTIRLFQLFGINVFLHWSWFLVAAYEISERKGTYSSVAWNVAEYLALFAIVTMHEFGHALACQQVGGRANQIVLWPLGGVAFVDPPPRPGATLWSIAAGPLVNVALMPVLGGLVLLSSRWGLPQSAPDVHALLRSVLMIDIVLFVFNVLPVYPLDGGQILRSVLWYVMGRARSLMIAAVVGFLGVAGLALLAIRLNSVWLGILSAFAALQCVNGFKRAQSLKRMAEAPRREGFACPKCEAAPPIGAYWACGSCRRAFDLLETRQSFIAAPSSSLLNLTRYEPPNPSEETGTLGNVVACPACKARIVEVRCLECGAGSPVGDWKKNGAVAPPITIDPEVRSSRVPEFKSSTAANRPAPPSVVPIVFGIMTLFVGVLLLAIALLFFGLSSSQAARQPQYQAEIDKLWTSDGIAVPGEFTLRLRRAERYDAYLETRITDASSGDVVDIRVTNADSGLPVALSGLPLPQGFKRDGRELEPKASFTAPENGMYTLRASTKRAVPADAQIKVGPSARNANGSIASSGRSIAIIVSVFAMMFVTVAVVLFLYYRSRRIAFNASLQRFYESQGKEIA